MRIMTAESTYIGRCRPMTADEGKIHTALIRSADVVRLSVIRAWTHTVPHVQRLQSGSKLKNGTPFFEIVY